MTEKQIHFGKFEFAKEKGLEYLVNENIPETDFLLINEPNESFSLMFEKDFPVFTVPQNSDRPYCLFELKRHDRVIKFFCPERHKNLDSVVWYFYVEVFDENGSLGTTVDPTKNIGRLTVINFWGTWCPYCLIELPHFDRVAKECGDDVTIYAVHSTNGYGTAPDYVLENCEESKIVFLKDYEANGKKNSYYSALGGDGSYPFTVILDEKGIIVSTHVGAMTYEQLMGALRNAGLSENG